MAHDVIYLFFKVEEMRIRIFTACLMFEIKLVGICVKYCLWNNVLENYTFVNVFDVPED